MDKEDRDRLMRIETILTESVVPRLNDHGPRIKVLEKVAVVASVMWGGVCVAGYIAKDAAAEWLKRAIVGHHP